MPERILAYNVFRNARGHKWNSICSHFTGGAFVAHLNNVDSTQ